MIHLGGREALQVEKSCETCKHDEAFGCPSFIHYRCENYSEWEQADGEYITQSTGDEIRQKNYDLISRQAVIEYIEGSEAELGHRSENELVCQYIKELPPVKQEPKTGQFAKWVASEIFDEWEYNKDSFAEIACRKLAKLGIVRAKGDEWELVEP